jgi:hypothetical protein
LKTASTGAGGSSGPWGQPVVWLGILVFLASLAGCALMIVLAMGQPDSSPVRGGDYIMKVPVSRMPVDAGPAPPAPALTAPASTAPVAR